MVSGPIALLFLAITIFLIVLFTAKIKIHAFLVLFSAAILYGISIGISPFEIMEVVRKGWGGLITKVGLVYIFGTVTGEYIERTGAAISITNFLLRLFGKKRSPYALAYSGYIVATPINSDTSFIILSSVAKGLSCETGIPMTAMAVALAVGCSVGHGLIPPTPGPLAAAANYGADLGKVLMTGMFVAAITAIVGIQWAWRCGAKYKIMPKETTTYDEVIEKYGKIPHVGLALTPLVFPIVTISLATIAGLPSKPFGEGVFAKVINVIGDANVALFLGTLLAIALLVPKKDMREGLTTWIGNGLKNTTNMMFITAAGAALAEVIKMSPLIDYLGMVVAKWHLGIFVPFMLGSLLKLSIGSTSTSMITASGILAPLLPYLGIDPAIAVVATGAGATICSHANDSYFWVVNQFSGLDVDVTFKTHTPMTAILGVTAFIVTFILSLFIK